MGREDQLLDAINLIYEALLDDRLWPKALTGLADAIGVARITVGAFDRTHAFCSMSPRIDPLLVTSYHNYWAFRDPIWPRIATQPTGELFSLDSLIPRADYAATDVYNEWFRPAKVGLGLIGTNLRADDQFSATIFALNPPENDQISSEQMLAFKAALPHFDRAVRIHRLLRVQDLDHDTAPERLEKMGFGVMLVDRAGKVLFANAWARALLTPGSGFTVRGGYLFSTDRAAILHRLIASCSASNLSVPGRPGGEIAVPRRGARRPLHVTVTPLRARGTVAELPWLGVQLPVAMITIRNPAIEKRPN